MGARRRCCCGCQRTQTTSTGLNHRSWSKLATEINSETVHRRRTSPQPVHRGWLGDFSDLQLPPDNWMMAT